MRPCSVWTRAGGATPCGSGGRGGWKRRACRRRRGAKGRRTASRATTRSRSWTRPPSWPPLPGTARMARTLTRAAGAVRARRVVRAHAIGRARREMRPTAGAADAGRSARKEGGRTRTGLGRARSTPRSCAACGARTSRRPVRCRGALDLALRTYVGVDDVPASRGGVGARRAWHPCIGVWATSVFSAAWRASSARTRTRRSRPRWGRRAPCARSARKRAGGRPTVAALNEREARAGARRPDWASRRGRCRESEGIGAFCLPGAWGFAGTGTRHLGTAWPVFSLPGLFLPWPVPPGDAASARGGVEPARRGRAAARRARAFRGDRCAPPHLLAPHSRCGSNAAWTNERPPCPAGRARRPLPPARARPPARRAAVRVAVFGGVRACRLMPNCGGRHGVAGARRWRRRSSCGRAPSGSCPTPLHAACGPKRRPGSCAWRFWAERGTRRSGATRASRRRTGAGTRPTCCRRGA